MSADLAPKVLAVRLDSVGDVLLTGPALRAVAAGSSRLDLLVSPGAVDAARLLPGVDDVIVFDAPWTGHPPPAVAPERLDDLLGFLRGRAYDHVIVFTSFHQSALPMAMLARWAGVPHVSAYSEDYPGSLVDLRLHRMADGRPDTGEGGCHEAEAARFLALAAGFPVPEGDDHRLRIRPVPCPALPVEGPYVAVHPHASVPSRSLAEAQTGPIARALLEQGWSVVVTGSPGEQPAPALPDDPRVVDLTGGTSLVELAGVLAAAACVIVGNTGPAHLAAAVGTPVVSLFSPVVPVERWGPWGVPHVVLGDQEADCRGTRAQECPLPGHPCLGGVPPDAVVAAVEQLVGRPGGHEAERLEWGAVR